MIKGIGTDILEICKLQPVLGKPDYITDSFIQKTYTAAEIMLAERRPIPLYCYATRFAGKEAVYKALGTNGAAIRLCEIEILSHDNGAPFVNLYGNAKLFAKEREISNILISLSYEDHYAVAYAVAE